MALNKLTPAKGSLHNSKRVGRGQGSGKGGTSKRGHKGAQSRSGYSRKIGFEGGQMPIQRRLPKRGFKNPFRTEYAAMNLSMVEHYAEKFGVKELSVDFLRDMNIIQKSQLVKLLGNGELTKPVQVKFHAASKKALEKLQAAGGSFEKVEA